MEEFIKELEQYIDEKATECQEYENEDYFEGKLTAYIEVRSKLDALKAKYKKGD